MLILQSLLDIIFRKESIEELKRLLEESKKETAAARLQLEEARKKKEVVVAIRDGFLGTPPERIVRRLSSEDLSSAEPSSKRSKVQFGLKAFWGSPEEQALAEPVALSEDPRLRNRQQKSLSAIELDELRSKGEELLKAVQDELPAHDEASKAHEAKEFFREMGRRGGRPKGRKNSEKRKELTAREKLDIVEAFENLLPSASSRQEALTEVKKKLKLGNLSSERIKDILKNKTQWQQLCVDFDVGKQGGSRKGKRAAKVRKARGMRRKGGGRKREHEEQIQQLSRWLQKERSHGHGIRKSFLSEKFSELLVTEAERLLEASKTQNQELLQKLQVIEARHIMKKVENLKKYKYRENYVSKLMEWIGAKHCAKELTSHLSPLEEKIRIQLSWMAFDYQLWLAGSAPLEVLEQDGVLDPQHVLQMRKQIGPPAIGFADQIPLWAKTSGKKFVFDASEFSGSSTSDRKQFDLFRQDLVQAAEHFKNLEEKQQLVSVESKRPEGSRAISGSLTVKGASENEKYRITYEARQQVRWIEDSSAPGGFRPLGEVLSPLIVFPGAHARLSNISNEHKFLETEEFTVNGIQIRHQAGDKTRLMFSLVELRKKHPELFEDVEVCTQPSSNVDSVILSWSVQQQSRQQPYAVWSRDSFAAAFSESVLQCQSLASQFSAILLGKVTQKVQLTDTDFAATFKSDFRSVMQSIEYKQGVQHKIGVKEILEASQAATKKAIQRNEKTQWVVKGAVRNGLLVYVPTADKGLVKLLSDELQMGSHRIESSVFLPRLSWVDASGRPAKPDYSLSQTGSKLQDFIEWGYQNPVSDDQAETLDVQLALEDELQVPFENALYLRLDPSMRNCIQRAKLDETFTSLQEKMQNKEDKRKTKFQQRHTLRTFSRVELQKKLQKMSKQEAMKEVKPSVTTKKKVQVKNALGLAKKAGFAKKVKKTLKKGKAKQVLEKKASKLVLKEKEEAKKEQLAEKKEKEVKIEEVQVRVVAEAAGASAYGREGSVKKIELEQKQLAEEIDVFSPSGKVRVQVSQLQVLDPAWKKPSAWKTFVSLSRLQKAQLLEAAGLLPIAFSDNTDTLLETPASDNEMSDQHIHLSSWLFSWNFSKEMMEGVQFLNPYLSKQWLGAKVEKVDDGDVPGQPASFFEERIRKIASEATLLLIPVHTFEPIAHWTLLVGRKDSLESPFQWLYRDTLKNFSKPALEKAKAFAALISGEKPDFQHIEALLQSGETCAYWTLAYAEVEIAQRFEGPASRAFPPQLVQTWRARVKAFWLSLQKEETKQLQQKLELESKEQNRASEQQKKLEQAKAELENMKNLASVQAKKAAAALEKNSKYFQVQDLSEESREKIQLASLGDSGCSRCRYVSTGCLSCSGLKALSYYIRSEAFKKDKVPKWSGLFLRCRERIQLL